MSFYDIRLLNGAICAAVICSVCWGQGQSGGRRLLAVVPMVGQGTYEDPKRPMFVPAQGQQGVADDLSYSALPSDDGRFAIVEFSLSKPSKEGMKSLDAIAGSTAAGVQVFERGKQGRDDVERELRKVRKNFSFEELAGLKKAGER
jgi:hypothetical protein